MFDITDAVPNPTRRALIRPHFFQEPWILAAMPMRLEDQLEKRQPHPMEN